VGSELIGGGSSSPANQGASVALSGNGQVLALGDPLYGMCIPWSQPVASSALAIVACHHVAVPRVVNLGVNVHRQQVPNVPGFGAFVILSDGASSSVTFAL
jgi:hypothetical protein